MIFCKELNKEFATKEEMFLALKANKDKIIGLKKAAIKDSENSAFFFRASKEATKGLESTKGLGIGDTLYPVINTTYLLDSHGDLHVDGIWDNSLKDQAGKLYYAVDHQLKFGMIVSYPHEVDAFAQTMNWTDLGKDWPGTTQALIYKIQVTDKSNTDFVKAVADGVPLENSVRMQYVDMELCVDSDAKELALEKANFYKHLPLIANKEHAMSEGYFWAIKQAKIIKEGSAVFAGSNFVTPILPNDPAGAGQKDQQIPPEGRTVKSNSHNLI